MHICLPMVVVPRACYHGDCFHGLLLVYLGWMMCMVLDYSCRAFLSCTHYCGDLALQRLYWCTIHGTFAWWWNALVDIESLVLRWHDGIEHSPFLASLIHIRMHGDFFAQFSRLLNMNAHGLEMV